MHSLFDKSLPVPEIKSSDITFESTQSYLTKHNNNNNNNLPLEKVSSTPPVHHDSRPEKSFVLNLKLIIEEHTDVSFHGRVGAYFDRNLQKSPKGKNIFNNRISFNDYIKFITEDLNALQRKKHQLIENLVELLSPAFANEFRTAASYNQFCLELIQIIDLSMSTAESNKTSSSKTLSENIAIFWRGILLEVKLNDRTLINYENILKMLLVSVDKGILMALKLKELTEQFNRAKKDSPLSCFSWDYFNTICDANNLVGHHITQFILNYQKTCDGLATQFVYLPHLWTFIRSEMENEEQSTEYREKIKKIDKMLLNLPAFHEFHPQDKGRGLNQFMKLTIS